MVVSDQHEGIACSPGKVQECRRALVEVQVALTWAGWPSFTQVRATLGGHLVGLEANQVLIQESIDR